MAEFNKLEIIETDDDSIELIVDSVSVILRVIDDHLKEDDRNALFRDEDSTIIRSPLICKANEDHEERSY